MVSGFASAGTQAMMAVNAISQINIGGSAIGGGWGIAITAALTALMYFLPKIVNFFDNLTTTPTEVMD
jgi:hypothetical protein